ncbi:hypothetical protein [Amycolatopsis alba]|nr:hypothetical protein [Amycolatopsis alba]
MAIAAILVSGVRDEVTQGAIRDLALAPKRTSGPARCPDEAKTT